MSNRFTHVAVLLGGPSAEREVSLNSGRAVAAALRKSGYQVAECDPTEDDLGIPEGVEAAFIALHGTFGEDGTVQAMLERQGVPYTGPGPDASRLAFDKVATKVRLVEHGIPTPGFEVLRPGEPRTRELPVMVKPIRQGSSIGLYPVCSEDQWEAAIRGAAAYGDEILIEDFVEGAELTVGVIGDEVLPVVEIRAPDGCYDYEAKYTSGLTEYLVPAPLDPAVAARCADLAARTVAATSCTGFSRVDFRLAPDGNLYVLEINTIPGFTATSLLPKAAAAANIDFPTLCRRIMEAASLQSSPGSQG